MCVKIVTAPPYKANTLIVKMVGMLPGASAEYTTDINQKRLPAREAFFVLYILIMCYQITPCSIIAVATFMKPAIFAPFM